jgi:hypothetical protein
MESNVTAHERSLASNEERRAQGQSQTFQQLYGSQQQEQTILPGQSMQNQRRISVGNQFTDPGHSHYIQPPQDAQGWGFAQQDPGHCHTVADPGYRGLAKDYVNHDKQPAKPANPKQAYGDKKPPLHLIHAIGSLHESAALHSGKLKYGVNNFLEDPVEAMTYVGAMLRHIQQWVSGERRDLKELVHHLGAVKACAGILMTAEAAGTLIDNRPTTPVHGHNVNPAPVSYQQATANAFAEVEAVVEHLNKLYPEPK